MKVCFFSPTAYSYFRPDKAAWGGGAETQQLLVARHMLSKGIEVSFIVGDYDQPRVETVDGITLIKSFALFKGNRKLRFVPDMLRIRQAMRIADADIYNQRSTSFYTGQLAFFASELGKAFTFSLCSDFNCYADGRGALRGPMPHLYRYGIGKADAVIAQTEKQKRLMLQNFGRQTVVIRNGITIPPLETPRSHERQGSSEEGAGPWKGEDPGFLWVGRFLHEKRPELFLDIARALPEARFTMIGGWAGDEGYSATVARTAAGLANVTHLPFVPPAEIEAYYRQATALINTSTYEGFPNTYLHAWVYGVPVITLEIDPDDIISSHRIGTVAGTFEKLVEAVRRMHEDPSARNEMSSRASRYVRENHDIRNRGDDYIRLFEEVLTSSR
ncbi:MAG TPA: glycosyltransferase family 4 protein [Candidatus Bathyarchaeia archaeon]|nr:glycosyltransferase family 4 protein [Candidatus Bathyarchaeia archaeon]